MGEFVRVERDGAIATIRLHRPPMNALNAQVQHEIAAAAAQTGTDPAIRFSGLFTTEDRRAGDAQFRREWPWESHLHGALTPAERFLPIRRGQPGTARKEQQNTCS
jgi:hypothetical protein